MFDKVVNTAVGGTCCLFTVVIRNFAICVKSTCHLVTDTASSKQRKWCNSVSGLVPFTNIICKCSKDIICWV